MKPLTIETQRELVEALQEIRSRADHYDDNCEDCRESRAIIDAALAKARAEMGGV